MLAFVGGTISIVLGGAAAIWFSQHGISMGGFGAALAQYGLPTKLYPAFSLFSALAGPGVLFVAICAGGIVPYLHVRRLAPAIAMRAA
jgi:ABC-type lipoprotein release transport system permease subunit